MSLERKIPGLVSFQDSSDGDDIALADADDRDGVYISVLLPSSSHPPARCRPAESEVISAPVDKDEDDYLTPVACPEDEIRSPETGAHGADVLEGVSKKNSASETPPELLKLLLTCQGCGQKLEQPKILLCRHTVCLSCVTGGVQESRVVCSICQQSQPLPRGGPAHLSPSPAFATLLAYESGDQGQTSSNFCSACEEQREPENYCATCDATLCSACSRSHSKFKETKKHVLHPPKVSCIDPLSLVISRQHVSCTDHDEHIDSFCVTCGVLTCSSCYKDQHSSHDKDLLATMMHRVKRVKATLVTSVKRFHRGAQTLARDTQTYHHESQLQAERLLKELKQYELRSTEVIHTGVEKLCKAVEEAAKGVNATAEKTLEEAKNRNDILNLLHVLLARLGDNTSEVDLQSLVAFCNRSFKHANKTQHATLASRNLRHFRPTADLVRATRMFSIGSLVEIGQYPRILPATVKTCFNVSSVFSSISVSHFGEFYCASFISKSVDIYSPNGFHIRRLSTDVSQPWGTCLTLDGLLLVTECGSRDVFQSSVKVFSPAGTLLRLFGQGELKSAMGLSLTVDDEVAVCEENGPSVSVFDTNGSKLRTVKMDQNYKDRYLFVGPMHVACNINRDLAVCDDHRLIKIVTSDGRLRGQFPEVETTSNQRRHFEGLCTDRHGQIIVADSGLHGLHVLTSEGQSRGFLSLQGDLSEPMCVAETPDRRLVIASKNSKLAVVEVFENFANV